MIFDKLNLTFAAILKTLIIIKSTSVLNKVNLWKISNKNEICISMKYDVEKLPDKCWTSFHKTWICVHHHWLVSQLITIYICIKFKWGRYKFKNTSKLLARILFLFGVFERDCSLCGDLLLMRSSLHRQ